MAIGFVFVAGLSFLLVHISESDILGLMVKVCRSIWTKNISFFCNVDGFFHEKNCKSECRLFTEFCSCALNFLSCFFYFIFLKAMSSGNFNSNVSVTFGTKWDKPFAFILIRNLCSSLGDWCRIRSWERHWWRTGSSTSRSTTAWKGREKPTSSWWTLCWRLKVRDVRPTGHFLRMYNKCTSKITQWFQTSSFTAFYTCVATRDFSNVSYQKCQLLCCYI